MHPQFSGRFRKLLASSIAVRWLLYILPVVAILWIPGIVALVAYGASGSNGFDRPTVWSVGLVWWSIWLSAVWVGWWGCWLVAKLLPRLLTHTIGEFVHARCHRFSTSEPC